MTDIMTEVDRKHSKNDILTRTQLDLLSEAIDRRVPYRGQIEILVEQLWENCPRRQEAEEPRWLCFNSDMTVCGECQPFSEFCYLRSWMARFMNGILS